MSLQIGLPYSQLLPQDPLQMYKNLELYICRLFVLVYYTVSRLLITSSFPHYSLVQTVFFTITDLALIKLNLPSIQFSLIKAVSVSSRFL